MSNVTVRILLYKSDLIFTFRYFQITSTILYKISFTDDNEKDCGEDITDDESEKVMTTCIDDSSLHQVLLTHYPSHEILRIQSSSQ